MIGSCGILPRRRISSLTLAKNSQANAVSTVASKSLASPAVTIEPSKGALDHPMPRTDDKSGGGVGALDDLGRTGRVWRGRR